VQDIHGRLDQHDEHAEDGDDHIELGHAVAVLALTLQVHVCKKASYNWLHTRGVWMGW
jgi:hypothetical protein